MKINMYRSCLERNGYVSVVAEKGKQYVCDGRKQFSNPEIIANFCRTQLKIDECAEEHVFVFALNNRNHLMGVFEASIGTADGSIVPVREILRNLLALNAVRFALVHNHPTGYPFPSGDDVAVTERLKRAGEDVGVGILDHVIIGNYGNYYSFQEEGVM
jgi:DNA repair protein RadC